MQIQFLFYEGCPSHEKGLARLKKVMAEDGIDTEIEVLEILTEEQAAEWGFIGSPTILINGQDMVTPPAEAAPALTCRVYQLEDGRFNPLPSENMIRNALQSHRISE